MKMAHCHAWQVKDPLATLEQKHDGKSGRTVDQVDGPGHLLRSGEDCRDHRSQRGFIVGHPPRQQPAPFAVDEHQVVMALTGVDPGPCLLDLLHPALSLLVIGMPSTHSPSIPYTAIDVADLNQRSRRRRAPGWPIRRSHQRQKTGSHAPVLPAVRTVRQPGRSTR